LVRQLLDTAIAIIVAFVIWRLCIAVVDRFFGRRFISRFIPRVATFSQLAKSLISFVALIAVVLIVLNIWSVNVEPALWSAGIVTAALAFGAQTIVRDVLAGFSGLLEDQYDVGDALEITTTTNAVIVGTVETVGLRTTRLIDASGREIFVPNGNILMVANESRRPNRATFSITLPLRAPIDAMRDRIAAAAAAGADGAGAANADVSVSVVDVKPDLVTFSVAFHAPRAEMANRLADARQRISADLQQQGWLPSGPPS